MEPRSRQTSIGRLAEIGIENARTSIERLRTELNQAEHDLNAWAARAPAMDHSYGLYRAADTSRDIAIAFTLIRCRAREES